MPCAKKPSPISSFQHFSYAYFQLSSCPYVSHVSSDQNFVCTGTNPTHSVQCPILKHNLCSTIKNVPHNITVSYTVGYQTFLDLKILKFCPLMTTNFDTIVLTSHDQFHENRIKTTWLAS